MSKNRIKILSEEVSNRIAAGEVIERPASVVKELVENSIDAGADSITVNIEKGGKELIEITDNGTGMSENDALTAFERHATSKIRTVQDIFHIDSLGFRGEAMPSIASVSKLRLVTRTKEDDIASVVEFKGGKLTDVSKTSANCGTSVSVRKLFFNIPARRKFLKSDQVEFKHILRYIHYQAVLYPDIRFNLISNGKEKVNYPVAESLEQRLVALFGKDFFSSDKIEINAEDKENEIKISGFISGLDENKESVEDIKYLFVNGRFIKDKIIIHAIKAAYEPFVKKMKINYSGNILPYVLFLEIRPELIDLNVHPAKLEIRLRDPHLVHHLVKNTLSLALMDYEDKKFLHIQRKVSEKMNPKLNSGIIKEDKNYNPEITSPEKRLLNLRQPLEKKKTDKAGKNIIQPELFKTRSFGDNNFVSGEKEEINPEYGNQTSDNKKSETYIEPITGKSQTEQEKEPQKSKPINHLRTEEELINPWQLHQTYIFFQTQDGLLIIDQHAAHERIIYEKILHRIHGLPAPSQKLLFPIVIDLPPYLQLTVPDLIEENLEIIKKIGFGLKNFSGSSIVIDEIPAELEDWDGGKVFIDILKQLQEEFEETEDFRDSIAKSVSCKAAVKAGQKLSKKEMIALINGLFACEVPYFCPHGRPLIIKMTLREFEKRFKRIEN
ncbi:MAG: DNA mismatch repair protein MutL [Candidatus Cloacimonadota bacterium]|nr:MAG: DNA mismatch repair protein MutL [Candidatus Cloacimonadota bacterium]